MSLRLLQLEGSSLEELRERVLAEHGRRAKIIAAEKARSGLISGLFGRERYTMTVEVSDRPSRGAHVLLPDARAGIGALLDSADAADGFRSSSAVRALEGAGDQGMRTRERAVSGQESGWVAPGSTAAETGTEARRGPRRRAAESPERGRAGIRTAEWERRAAEPAARPHEPAVSTATPDFARLMDELTFTAGILEERSAPPPVPVAAGNHGDLVLILGLAGDPLTVARSMARRAIGADVRAGGLLTIPGTEPVQDRRSALAARAAGVIRRGTTFVAYGIGSDARGLAEQASALAAISPDQVWVVVDAGRKSEDTASWVGAVATALPLFAMAVLGAGATATPQTVNELGLPIGWVDDGPAVASRL